MSVVPFSSARFTPADLAEFNRVSLPRCARGLWSAISRQTMRDRDRLAVYTAGAKNPLFTVERDGSGSYSLFYHNGGEPHRIGFGETVAECLAIWMDRPAADSQAAN
jgi:hypothetical protein